MSKKLTSFQVFNSMRIYLSIYHTKTNAEDIGMLLGGLQLFKDFDDWQENPETWDPPAWEDWMDGVDKTLNDLKIKTHFKKIAYDEDIAFLCMKNYLQLLYNQFSFEDVGNLLKILNNSQSTTSDPIWQQWLQAIDHSINNTYPLDEPLRG